MMQLEIPLELYVAQWVLLAGLGLFVVIAFRQLAYYRGLTAADAGGLEVGSRAPKFKYRMFSDGAAAGDVKEFVPGSRSLALMFGDPSCGACDRAISELERLSELPGGETWDTFFATAATAEEVGRSDTFRGARLPLGIVDPDVVQVLYQVQQLPLLYAVDASGTIRAKGVVSDGLTVKKILSTGENQFSTPRRGARRPFQERGANGSHN